MDIDVDINVVLNELLEQNKALTLENIILKKALEGYKASEAGAPVEQEVSSADTEM